MMMAYAEPAVMPNNPGGGALPGQPRNPAAGGYPKRGMGVPLRPGMVPGARPDPRAMLGVGSPFAGWQDWMREQRTPWGGNMGGAVPGTRPDIAMAPVSPEQKQADLERYKANLRGSAQQGANAMRGGGMTDVYYDTRPPAWMDQGRANEIAGRINGRTMGDEPMGGGVAYPEPGMGGARPAIPDWWQTGGFGGGLRARSPYAPQPFTSGAKPGGPAGPGQASTGQDQVVFPA